MRSAPLVLLALLLVGSVGTLAVLLDTQAGAPLVEARDVVPMQHAATAREPADLEPPATRVDRSPPEPAAATRAVIGRYGDPRADVPTGSLEGRVVQRGGGALTAVVEARLEAPAVPRADGSQPVRADWTEPDGRFRMEDLPAGRWRVAATLDRATWSAPRLVEVEPGAHTSLEPFVLLQPAPEPTFTGWVVDEAGLPVTGALVLYFRSGGGSGVTRSTARGEFAVQGAFGERIDLTVEAAGKTPARLQAAVGDGPVEVVLREAPVVVVTLEVPVGFRARDVTWRFLDAAERPVLRHTARALEERVDWPEGANWIDVRADDRFESARAALPPRPARGEERVSLVLRRAGH